MDKIIFLEKNAELLTRFAAPSVLTGYFVAAVPGATVDQMTELFTNAGEMLVHNMDDLYADKVYTGYNHINEIREGSNEITVILDKEVHNASK